MRESPAKALLQLQVVKKKSAELRGENSSHLSYEIERPSRFCGIFEKATSLQRWLILCGKRPVVRVGVHLALAYEHYEKRHSGELRLINNRFARLERVQVLPC